MENKPKIKEKILQLNRRIPGSIFIFQNLLNNLFFHKKTVAPPQESNGRPLNSMVFVLHGNSPKIKVYRCECLIKL